jgi:hypothetical protein
MTNSVSVFSPIRAIALTMFLLVVIPSCKEDDDPALKPSSIKIIPTENEPKQVRMIASLSGSILAYTSSGDLVFPPVSSEMFILNESGEEVKRLGLSDTLFQHVNAIAGINGGFFVCATTNNLNYIAIYQVSDLGVVEWSKSFAVKFGVNKNLPDVTISNDGNYMVMYQSLGSGYYIWKGDVNGNEIFNRKYPTPNAVHYGTGLNYGERYVNFFQANDTLIITQGITFDQYDQLIENCFLRAVNTDVQKRWYSTNFDSTHIENGVELAMVNQNIVLFGNRSSNTLAEYAGDVFARYYSLDGTYGGTSFFPRIGGTPNIIRSVIRVPGGGFLLVGNNNQLPNNDLVSDTQLILIRLNPDLSVQWTQELKTAYPAKGFDAVFHANGSIGLMGLIKDNFSENKLLYLHLDQGGRIINN